jgi:DNA topoisomerase-1
VTDDHLRVLAGDCTVVFEGEERREERGRVVTLVKPDGTVMVHGAAGYRPVAWLTRAAAVSCSRGDPPRVLAQDDGRSLRVRGHEATLSRHPVSRAGPTVGACPDCDGALVRAGGAVACLDCDREHGVPEDAAVRETTCPDCGLPTMAVERGVAVEVCVDRACDPLVEALRERVGGEWACPACSGDLELVQQGRLLAGCEHYPDCETAYTLPRGTRTGECDCGLPRFETAGGERCLDARCDAVEG